MMRKFFIFFILIICVVPNITHASATNGAIDATYMYAWSEHDGWINFGTTSGNVHVTDTALTGYAWNDNTGWISLQPASGGVINDGAGNLSGRAWGEGVGWINFSGVTIDSSGNFSGIATADDGRISFNCSNTSSCGSGNFKVVTDWRPASVRNVATSTQTYSGHHPIFITPRPATTIVSNLVSQTSSNISSNISNLEQNQKDCEPYIKSYLLYNTKNNKDNVLRLKKFLNKFEGEKLPINSLYTKAVVSAVSRFQVKEMGIKKPTGNVYAATKNEINALYCERNK